MDFGRKEAAAKMKHGHFFISGVRLETILKTLAKTLFFSLDIDL